MFIFLFIKIFFPILALEGDLPRLTHLLKKGTVCADSLDSAGYSPLHYASRAGHVDIVKYLISAGAVCAFLLLKLSYLFVEKLYFSSNSLFY